MTICLNHLMPQQKERHLPERSTPNYPLRGHHSSCHIPTAMITGCILLCVVMASTTELSGKADGCHPISVFSTCRRCHIFATHADNIICSQAYQLYYRSIVLSTSFQAVHNSTSSIMLFEPSSWLPPLVSTCKLNGSSTFSVAAVAN